MNPNHDPKNGQFTSGGSPSFLDYSKKYLGNNYVIAKPTEKNKSRYPGAHFVTNSQFNALKEQYRSDHPAAADAYFGKR